MIGRFEQIVSTFKLVYVEVEPIALFRWNLLSYYHHSIEINCQNYPTILLYFSPRLYFYYNMQFFRILSSFIALPYLYSGQCLSHHKYKTKTHKFHLDLCPLLCTILRRAISVAVQSCNLAGHTKWLHTNINNKRIRGAKLNMFFKCVLVVLCTFTSIHLAVAEKVELTCDELGLLPQLRY